MTDTDVRPPVPPRVEAHHTSGPPRFASLRLGALVVLLIAIGSFWPWVLVTILGLVVMIFLHELGHYVMAKRAGMLVTEFFLGFGPKLWSFRRGETEYGVKLIPAGAYVKIIGMHNLEEVAPEDEARSYRQKSFGQRLSVAVAGSTMHFLLALVLIFVSMTAVGTPGGHNFLPSPSKWVVGEITPGSAADEAGLKERDKLVSIDGHGVGTFQDLKAVVEPLRNHRVEVRWQHNGVAESATVKLRDFTDKQQRRACCLGIGEGQEPIRRVGPVAAVPGAFQGFGEATVVSLGAFGKVFSPSGIANFAGLVADGGAKSQSTANQTKSADSSANTPPPRSTRSADDTAELNRPISIFGVVQAGSTIGADGAGSLIFFFALINIFIGIFNLVPMLPFDGGHVAIAAYEKVQEVRQRRRTRYFADISRLLPLTYMVVMLLGLLFVSTAYLDLVDPILGK